MRNLIKNDQTGRSMVEMLGVLAIIGVLSVGGIAGYSKAMAKYKISKTLDQISMLVTNIRTFYGNRANFKGLSNTTAFNYDLVSPDMVATASGADLRNPFGGKITITQDDAKGTFSVKYESIDRMSCITIATADWGGSASSGLVSMAIGTGSGTSHDWTASTDAAGLPITFTGADSQCKAGDANIISWTYR